MSEPLAYLFEKAGFYSDALELYVEVFPWWDFNFFLTFFRRYWKIYFKKSSKNWKTRIFSVKNLKIKNMKQILIDDEMVQNNFEAILSICHKNKNHEEKRVIKEISQLFLKLKRTCGFSFWINFWVFKTHLKVQFLRIPVSKNSNPVSLKYWVIYWRKLWKMCHWYNLLM